MKVIQLENVSKIFYRFDKSSEFPFFQPVQALDDISLKIEQGEFVSIRGLNGSGKTTFFNLIIGLQKPTKGTIKLFGADVTNAPISREIKSRLGVMLQKVALPKKLSVKELVRLFHSYYASLEEATSLELSVDEKVNEILKLVSLGERSDFCEKALSGGWEQRVYVALALSGNPDLLLLDEPTRNLDNSERDGKPKFWNLLKSLSEQGKTILVITQEDSGDDRYVCELASRFIKFHEGKIVEDSNKLEEKDSEQLKELEITSQVLKSENSIYILREQLWAEFLQLIREPLGIALSIVPSFIPVLLASKSTSPTAETYRLLIATVVLALLMVNSQILGIRVSDEREKGWMPLLHVTPLPSWIYVTSKIITSLIVSGVLLFFVFIVFIYLASTERLEFLPAQWLLLFISLIIGVIPFGALSLALAYLVEKSTSAIVNVLVIMGWATSGLLSGFEELLPSFLQKLAPYSPLPTYHYARLVLQAGGIPEKHTHFLLHIQWLLWATLVYGLLAVFGYRRRLIDQNETLKWYELSKRFYNKLFKKTINATEFES